MTSASDDPAAPPGAFQATLTGIGTQGDALGRGPDRAVFVAFGLPGERVIAVPRRTNAQGMWAEAWRILKPSPERIEAACRHFGICGGCKLQHWREQSYRAWKSGLAAEALGRHGLTAPGHFTMEFIGERSRRRIELAAIGRRESPFLGFHEMASGRIVNVLECPVLEPQLAAFLAPLRECLGTCLDAGERLDILLTLAENGMDIVVTADDPAGERHRAAFVALARETGTVRVCWRAGKGGPDIICQLGTPVISFDGVSVDLPAPSFLQPTRQGESMLRSRLTSLLSRSGRVAELHCGCGTFTFAIARFAHVLAIDAARPAIEALGSAARRSGLQHRIETSLRDLEGSPLSPQELRAVDTVVLDPPRAGARRQCVSLAKSDVRAILYVSCNPASFARDARLLADGGFELRSLMAVDQFRWSAHLELVGEFRRTRPR